MMNVSALINIFSLSIDILDVSNMPNVMQVGGFLQRIDYVRKHAFAVMCILKDSEGQFPIRCVPGRSVAHRTFTPYAIIISPAD